MQCAQECENHQQGHPGKRPLWQGSHHVPCESTALCVRLQSRLPRPCWQSMASLPTFGCPPSRRTALYVESVQQLKLYTVCQQVVFETLEAATAAADAVHNVEWPVGNNSKLKAKYVDAEEAADAIAVGRGEKLPSGAQTAPEPGAAYFSRFWLPLHRAMRAVPDKQPAKAKPAATDKVERSLDDLFRKTTAQPAIYWLPLPDTSASNGKQ